ncbi:hypothetical protein COL26b_006614, partial [Colletotrichum chrysophilum]|uniref:uncharacterized protein n=1 Tax=Colletotrichum chrysophilum TaxID=1836956 RepID=UPI0023019EF5
MRGLAQALLLAPALVGAAPSRIDEKVKDASPSTFVTFDIPPGFNEDHSTPYTLHLEVLEAPSPCAYPNIKVNDNPLSQRGHTLGRGTFTGDHDGSTFIASWTATCAGDEQLLRFNLESLAGRSLASDVAFVARFRQTSPASIIEVAGPVRVSTDRPQPPSLSLPEWDGHRPRPGDDEDGLLDDPPFPPPPHHHVGNHNEADFHHPPKHNGEDRPHPPHGHDGEKEHHPHHSPEVEAEIHELDCLRHQLHALKHLIHEKEARLAHEHGVRLHRHALRECDSLKCVLDTLMHRVGGGFRGGFHGFGGGRRHRGPGHHHGGPPPMCGAFPSPGGNHTHGNHTAPPPPPPPPGFCPCGPPPPEGEWPHHGPPPPFDEPPHHGPPHGDFDEPPR